jgi:large subunit ribosomal protein L9
MKVILNKDLAPLGEEGDVKEVAKGYFRNYLFPRGIALPYTDSTVKLFESRREQIEARKAEKRKAAASVKEKLEALSLVLTMPAGANGKLYGAVTSQTVSDELTRLGFQLERKRIELPGNTFKSVGKYKITLKLYEGASAEIPLTVQGQALKTETKTTTQEKGRRHRRSEATPAEAAIAAAPAAVAPETPVPEASAEAATASPAQG